MTPAEKQAEIMAIDPYLGRLVDAACRFLEDEAIMRDPEEYRREQQDEAMRQLDILAVDLERTYRRPIGLGIAPNSPDFDLQLQRERAARGDEKFPARLGFKKWGKKAAKEPGKQKARA